MAPKKTDIIVYAHWHGMPDPIKMGVLSAQEARGHLDLLNFSLQTKL